MIIIDHRITTGGYRTQKFIDQLIFIPLDQVGDGISKMCQKPLFVIAEFRESVFVMEK